MFKNLKNKKGFTLIELIVVVAIIGILVAILVPTVSGYIDKAKIVVLQSDAKTIYSAVATAQIEAESSTIGYQYGVLDGSNPRTRLAGVGVTKGRNKATAPAGYLNTAGPGGFGFPAVAGGYVFGAKSRIIGRFKGGTQLTGADLAASAPFEDALNKFADKALDTIGVNNVLFFFD